MSDQKLYLLNECLRLKDAVKYIAISCYLMHYLMLTNETLFYKFRLLDL